MIQISKNVYVENRIKACNLGLITTREGIVLIDVPLAPSDAVKWRDEVAKKGELRYLINTEEHADHCQNSWFFPGILITSQQTREKLAKEKIETVIERVKRTDPGGLPLMKGYRLRLADIAFTESLNIYLGDHTLRLFKLQGHSSGGIAVHLPEDRVVFTTDCVFHRVKSWLPEADPDQWFESLKKIGELDVDVIVPGHGEICKKDYLKEQSDIIRQWVDLVKSAIQKGWSVDEATRRISQPDPYPKQPGTPMTEDELNRAIITRLYQLYSK
jgi:cyclase